MKRDRRKAPVRRLARRWIWRGLLFAAGLLLAWQVWLLGHVVYYVWHDPQASALMQARAVERRASGIEGPLAQVWVEYERISPHLKRAVLAAEDARFLEHGGFDWDGIRHAARRNLREGRVVAGGSTVTQQLAKNLFLSDRRTPQRKAQEAVIAVMLESVMSKRRILELYLNVIEWGDGIFGAEAAAHHYFGTSAAALEPPQAARLAAMISNPRYYQRHPDSPALQRKSRVMATRMGQVHIP